MNANCSVMLALSSSKPLLLSLSFNLLFAAIALPILIWASYKLWTGVYSQRLHRNIRLIAQTHLFGFTLHCYGRVVLHFLDLHNYLFLEPCQMIPDIYRCFVFRFMFNYGLWVTNFTAIPLVIERIEATRKMGRYENKYHWIGAVLALMSPCLAMFPIGLAYYNTTFDGVFMPYCSVYKPAFPEIANANSIIIIFCQMSARLMFSYLFSVNKKRRAKMQSASLATRFQLEQNKNSMECLKIFSNISTLFLLIQVPSFAWLLKEAPGMARENYLALMELNCAFPIYGIITVVLISIKISSIRSQITSSLQSQVNLKGYTTYFESLNQQINSIQKY